tara:strand:- start:947 stop:1732 length:786 start_codon:yes stop_codon:yes gene_type:complete
MNISVVSGGFDPIHSGHISYFEAAKSYGDLLVVALNSDDWLKRKKGKPFMPFHERKKIIESLKMVDSVIDFKDDAEGSATNAIIKVKKLYPNDKIIFCNGGDRDESNITEMEIKDIDFIFGVGGDSKMNSSSDILKEWKTNSEDRIWGSFSTLYQDKDIKFKELVIKPGKGISFQRHFKRDEIWFLSNGKCNVKYAQKNPKDSKIIILNKFDTFCVKRSEWHQIFNPYEKECKIFEIQYGEQTNEGDIERLSYFEGNNDEK